MPYGLPSANHVPSVGRPKQISALAHLECTRVAGTSKLILNLKVLTYKHLISQWLSYINIKNLEQYFLVK